MTGPVEFGGNMIGTGAAAAILFRALCVVEAWIKKRYHPEKDKHQQILDRLTKGDENFVKLGDQIQEMKLEVTTSVHALDRRLVVVETRLGQRVPRITRSEL